MCMCMCMHMCMCMYYYFHTVVVLLFLCTDFRRVETLLVASLRGDGKVGFKGLSPGGWLGEAADVVE